MEIGTAESFPLLPLTPEERTPFGHVDPARSTTAELLSEFVDFDGDPRFGGLATRDADLRTMIIVGSRGSGRTTYIRRAHHLASQRPGLVALPIENEGIPETDLVREVCDWYAPATVVRKVQQLWRSAVLRALSSRALRDSRLNEPLGNPGSAGWEDFVDTFEGVLEQRNRLGSEWSAEHDTVYGQLTNIVSTHESREALDELLHDDLWDKLEARLATVLQLSPVVHLYLDAFDQESRHAPQEWFIWEKALFYQVFHFARTYGLADRLRIVTTLRDVTYSAIRGGDSGTKYPPSDGIRMLEWNTAAANAFLTAKVRALNAHWLMRPFDEVGTAATWLGCLKIHNARLDHDEDVVDYVVSHTRNLPRDIVQMGNELSVAVLTAKAEGCPAVPDAAIREIVAEVAQSAGREQVGIAAADASSFIDKTQYGDVVSELDVRPRGESASQHLPLQRDVADLLERLVRDVGYQYFGIAEWQRAVATTTEMLRDVDLLSVLWRNGLVGVWRSTESGLSPVFYGSGRWDQLTIPPGDEHFAFHRILFDVVGIRPGWPLAETTALYIEAAAGPAVVIANTLNALDEIYSAVWDLGARITQLESGSRVFESGDATHEALVVIRVELGSPGFWIFGGNGSVLRETRGLLQDHHQRRQDREYREPAERDRLSLENDLRRLEVIEKLVQLAQRAGIPELEIAAMVNDQIERLLSPLTIVEEELKLESMRLLGPGEITKDAGGA